MTFRDIINERAARDFGLKVKAVMKNKGMSALLNWPMEPLRD